MHYDYAALQQWVWKFNPEHKAIRWLRPGQVNFDLIHKTNVCTLQHYIFYNILLYHLMGKCPKFQLLLTMDLTLQENVWSAFSNQKKITDFWKYLNVWALQRWWKRRFKGADNNWFERFVPEWLGLGRACRTQYSSIEIQRQSIAMTYILEIILLTNNFAEIYIFAFILTAHWGEIISCPSSFQSQNCKVLPGNIFSAKNVIKGFALMILYLQRVYFPLDM